jgi:hypothetical protein
MNRRQLLNGLCTLGLCSLIPSSVLSAKLTPQQIFTNSDISILMDKYYSRLTPYQTNNTPFSHFTDPKPLPKNEGKTIQFYRYNIGG